MKSLIQKILAAVLMLTVCGCEKIKPYVPKPDIPAVIPTPAPDAACACAAYPNTIPVPTEYVGGECDIFPIDVRVLAWNGHDWSFVGAFAKKSGIVTTSGKTVTGASKEIDGRCWQYEGYRPGKEGNPLCTNSVGTYNGGTYRCYFKVKTK